MSVMWENIVGQLGKWSQVISNRSRYYFKKVKNKGEELTRIGKIQLEIEKYKRELKSKYTDLGKLVYKNFSEESENYLETEEFKKLTKDINSLELVIRERKKAKQEKIEEDPDQEKELQSD